MTGGSDIVLAVQFTSAGSSATMTIGCISAVTTAGAVSCWGQNTAGSWEHPGTDAPRNSVTPVAVVGASSGVVAVAGGVNYTCARYTSGAVLATLDGDGQNDPRDIPRLLEALDAETHQGVQPTTAVLIALLYLRIVERELDPQVWSTRQPFFAERIAASQAKISSKK